MLELPSSLKHLVLDGLTGENCRPPTNLRLGGLTRLETLTLLGCACRALDELVLGDCADEPPLPPSLRTLRLEAPMTLRLGESQAEPGQFSALNSFVEASVRSIECHTDATPDGVPRSAMPCGSPVVLGGRGFRRTSDGRPPQVQVGLTLKR